MTRSLRFIVPVFAVSALLAGCGGEEVERASAGTDANALLRDTFINTDKMRSATVDVKLRIEPRGTGDAQGPITAHLQGPFETQDKGEPPKFAFATTLENGGHSVSAGATWTGEKGYVNLQGTPYEVSNLVMNQFLAGYEQALKNRSGGGGVVLGTLGIDFTKWLRSARNDGPAKVGDTDTIKLSGSADVAQVVADLDKISRRAQALNLPGASGKLPEQLTPEQRKEAADAVKALDLAVYTGVEDRMLRRLLLNADLSYEDVDATVALDITFTRVDEDQSIEAPANPKPFSELLKAANAAGLSDLSALGGSDDAAPATGAGTNNVDKYAACIDQAGGDRAKARKCAALLSG